MYSEPDLRELADSSGIPHYLSMDSDQVDAGSIVLPTRLKVKLDKESLRAKKKGEKNSERATLTYKQVEDFKRSLTGSIYYVYVTSNRLTGSIVLCFSFHRAFLRNMSIAITCVALGYLWPKFVAMAPHTLDTFALVMACI